MIPLSVTQRYERGHNWTMFFSVTQTHEETLFRSHSDYLQRYEKSLNKNLRFLHPTLGWYPVHPGQQS